MSDISISQEIIVERDSKTGRFLPGNSGFGGRPKGSRNRLGEQFLDDLYADWQKGRIEAIAACRKADPAAYLRVIAGLMPKDLNITLGVNFAELHSREEVLAAVIEEKGEEAARLLAQLIALDGPVIEPRTVEPD
jgi:hypothetical protein